MKTVIQRVKEAWVCVDSQEVSRVGCGLAILLGVEKGDAVRDVTFLVEKIANLRVFEDDAGKMNLSVLEIGGEALVVSQFTLLANCRKGRRPGFDAAADPETAVLLYNDFVAGLSTSGVRVSTGVFQAKMEFGIINDGPVTLILDTRTMLL